MNLPKIGDIISLKHCLDWNKTKYEMLILTITKQGADYYSGHEDKYGEWFVPVNWFVQNPADWDIMGHDQSTAEGMPEKHECTFLKYRGFTDVFEYCIGCDIKRSCAP